MSDAITFPGHIFTVAIYTSEDEDAKPDTTFNIYAHDDQAARSKALDLWGDISERDLAYCTVTHIAWVDDSADEPE